MESSGVVYEVYSYRTIRDVVLDAHVVRPRDDGDRSRRPAIAYFHPGAWRAGGPGDDARRFRYLASRGMIAASFGYRLLPSPGRKSDGKPGVRYGAAQSKRDCVADAQAAVRWLRQCTDVDGNRIVAAGYSAGAHLAAAAALVPSVEPMESSCRPDALVFYAGVFDLRDSEISPLAHIRQGAPPALVMCGADDSLASQGRRVTQALTAAGNRAEYVEFPGGHETFAARGDNPVFAASLACADEFLVSLGYLDAVPDVERRIADLDVLAPMSRKQRKVRSANSEDKRADAEDKRGAGTASTPPWASH